MKCITPHFYSRLEKKKQVIQKYKKKKENITDLYWSSLTLKNKVIISVTANKINSNLYKAGL